MKILAIETSCDETAASVVQDGTKILSNVVASSSAMHEKYGGIVPEVAAREQLKCVIPVIIEALKPLKTGVNVSMFQCINDSIDAIAVTVGPGLIGSLLTGVETAKTIAYVTDKPIIPVNHVLAHMYANFLEPLSCHSREDGNLTSKTQIPDQVWDDKTIKFPAISLVVSGGHTELYLMKSVKELCWLGGTLDDAAGECFDKAARLLGFGNRGGVAIQETAAKFTIHNSQFTIPLPRPMLNDDSLNFSFSGLKTAILREIDKLKRNQQYNNRTIEQSSYEVQEAITDVLVEKTLRAAQKYKAKSILLSGGVAANIRLREKFFSTIKQFNNITIHVPSPELCTDNAAYIGAYAFFRGKSTDWKKITAVPDLAVEVGEA
ncbi:tRNA (adenosine(37)-N6)-threonylcarbamoyltransferase complex transferase subunit TsaD [Patescibacteria group bacterium]|nr:tRNA (adenosine(37)-N6)-threonylcarbamoyltransferase complex transferase subunit TsaD [Patescibacteria group bacterium]MBU1473077.1 tRNA (adenosine(37)-N6)-threonylcarbamoyltransferase complex transferase subunit TsaD [Patescibacteria group bacterium]MBU2460167.1 tRNA (adenosine(37)-N6)-threonylcarbamoyltransferase complex transferase subunit TsaD [Patescibacteria group bacterium]MBU2544483.1 tRNA (adenosine(37)-N6)-threonylcarbamoyltransferase complex transferase subunit TsaD [Patescibacteri